MKKMCPKAFGLLAGGLGAAIVYAIINFIVGMSQDVSVAFAEFEMLGEGIVELMTNMYVAILVIALLGNLAFNGYFLFRVIRNKQKESHQVYLTVLFVFSIIFLVFSVLSLIGGVLALINITINVLIIVGRVMQNKYNPPREDDTNVTY